MVELEAYIQANEARWAAVIPTELPDTGRLKTRKMVHALMDKHFSVDGLEQACFLAWGKDPQDLSLSYNSKRGLIREMILYAVGGGGVSKLVDVLKEERPFVEWPEFE